MKVVQRAFEAGLHVVGDNQSTLQLMPPLTIARQTLDEGLDILIDCVKSV
jgi:4-aminobutyrate aminotransferase-like enzyme